MLETPEALPIHFVEAWNERDADKLAEVFDDDADFVNVVGIWWRNREAIRKAHDYGLRNLFQHSELKLTKTSVKYLGDQVAIIHARMRLSGQTPLDGSRPETRFTLFSFVSHRGDNGWSCASAHNTDIVPGKETHLRDSDGTLKAVDYRKKS